MNRSFSLKPPEITHSSLIIPETYQRMFLLLFKEDKNPWTTPNNKQKENYEKCFDCRNTPRPTTDTVISLTKSLDIYKNSPDKFRILVANSSYLTYQ